MVHIWFLNHGTHSVLHGSIGEFIEAVFIPNVFKIEVWSANLWLKEGQISSMRNGLGIVMKLAGEWNGKLRRGSIRIVISLDVG